MDDIETGGKRPGNGGDDLDDFFGAVEIVKQDIKEVVELYKRLQGLNEESKTVHNAKTMKDLRSRMDADVAQVLKRVKLIKGKIEGLDRSNIEHRKLPGCGPGSSADRTRTSVVSGLGKKLKDMMDDFQALRGRMNEEYKETVARRYFTVTGEKPEDEMIENLISSGESESFLQKAIQDQGRGQILDTISEIQERHDAVKEIEKNLIELHQIFLDVASLVEAQGQQLNNIENQVAHASSFVRRGTDQLQEARELQKGSRKCACYAVILVIIILCVLSFPVWWPIVVANFRVPEHCLLRKSSDSSSSVNFCNLIAPGPGLKTESSPLSEHGSFPFSELPMHHAPGAKRFVRSSSSLSILSNTGSSLRNFLANAAPLLTILLKSFMVNDLGCCLGGLSQAI
ncbi:hypothetical protein Leryth_005960 [Lithospermum erythrorhizon]|nr:hypothetical protein Leryth_005960 [Lithospermum erythrorhizon]